MLVSLQNSCTEALTPNRMVFERRPLRGNLRREGRIWSDGISDLTRDSRGMAQSLCHGRIQWEGSHLHGRKKSSHQNTTMLASWSQTPSLQKYEKIHFRCLSIQPIILLEQTKTVSIQFFSISSSIECLLNANHHIRHHEHINVNHVWVSERPYSG